MARNFIYFTAKQWNTVYSTCHILTVRCHHCPGSTDNEVRRQIKFLTIYINQIPYHTYRHVVLLQVMLEKLGSKVHNTTSCCSLASHVEKPMFQSSQHNFMSFSCKSCWKTYVPKFTTQLYVALLQVMLEKLWSKVHNVRFVSKIKKD